MGCLAQALAAAAGREQGLEAEVAELRRQVASLTHQLDELNRQELAAVRLVLWE